LALYHELLRLVEGRDVMLEEYARQQIAAESRHVSDVEKMLRQAH
jgi:bacterioferritin